MIMWRAGFILCCTAFALMAQSALARSYIRDAEIEYTLRRMTDPILTAADIQPDAVRIFIIQDPSINAFVAGGQNIFFHTGLLLKLNRPQMLMGVIAHEAGHIAGAHLTQLTSASDDAALGALLSYILGAAAAIGGSPEAGGAIISAGQNTSLRNLLSHYRGNEQQADQAAIRFLKQINLSPQGMLDTFELLRRKEHQRIGQGGDPYLRTHPLSTDRIATMRSEIQQARGLPNAPSAETVRWFNRMQAKLFSFFSPFDAVLQRYPHTDRSEAAHLARAVAQFRRPDLPAALEEMNHLITLSPDAYSYDLKGQILFEHGRIDAAIAAYEQAAQLAPDTALILTDLGKSYIASQDSTRLVQAVAVLEKAARLNDRNARTYRHLATAYGKQGKLGASYLALAREAALLHEPEDIQRYAHEAIKRLQDNPVLLLQAEDLLADAKRLEEKAEQD